MSHHEFTLVLDRIPDDDGYDLLFEVGCDDATPETRGGVSLLHFDRDAPTVAHALVTAVRNAEQAGFQVQAVETDDLVSLRTVADRIGRTYEGVRLLATGRRGPGAFPAPLSGDGWSLYSWSQVVDWSTKHLGLKHTVGRFEVAIAAANHIVRARNLLPEDSERTELAELL